MSEATTLEKSGNEFKNVSRRQEQQDLIDQLLKPEVQDSLTNLVEQLPKLTEIVNILTKSYDMAQSLATDEVLKNDTVGAITEIAEPVVATVKSVAATAIEAKDRAQDNHEAIGLFGLLKMLKDPQAQQLFRFVHAYLEVSSEKNNQK